MLRTFGKAEGKLMVLPSRPLTNRLVNFADPDMPLAEFVFVGLFTDVAASVLLDFGTVLARLFIKTLESEVHS